MDHLGKVIALHDVLRANLRGVTIERMMQVTDSKRSTVYRLLPDVERTYKVPIRSSGHPAIWSIARESTEGFQFTGQWMSASQLFGLRLVEKLINTGQEGALTARLDEIAPWLRKSLGTLAEELDRLHVERGPYRVIDAAVFDDCGSATLERRQLQFLYQGRTTGDTKEHTRHVSPQLITFYRENFYLEAWDHVREGMRSFALDLIRKPRFLADARAHEVPRAELQDFLRKGYGFHCGPIIGTATIRFSPEIARWICAERWHNAQRVRHRADGSLELRLPYSHSKVLLMDVLRWGPDAEVISPKPLRQEAAEMAARLNAKYNAKKPAPRSASPA